MKDAELEQAILDLVQRGNYRPVKPRVIAQKLQLPKERVAEAKKSIKRLVRRGQLAYAANHLVQAAEPAGPQADRVVGVFRRTQRGYGFVRPAPPASGDELPDIYISAKKAGNASTGDLVLVQLGRHPHPKQLGPKGQIVEVLQRETRQFVGTYLEAGGSGAVQVDGGLFSRAIPVGDPGAKNARPDDKVVCEIIRFPSQLHDGEGVITEVLGPRGKPGVDTLSIIREFSLPGSFAQDALDEARLEADNLPESVPDDRLDLTDRTIITIDPADARDFDDAISLEMLDSDRSKQGARWRLGVHIADVSHFVRPKTALDREARNRATSVYLPDRVIPMLPDIISNNLASLQPGKIRYTKTVFIEFTSDGLRVGTESHSAAIKSRKRLTYDQVDSFLEDPAPWRRKLGKKVHELLGGMHQLAMILRARRIKKGALELNLPEVKIELDRQGRVAGAHTVENTQSHQIIEEFMLAANEAVAEMLHEKELDFLRRVHPAPSPQKLKALKEFVDALGLKTKSPQNRFELQKLLARVAGKPEEHAVHYAVLRSMQQAVYSPEREGHYALATDLYCHFTSPIRRYPDLSVHRTLAAILLGKRPPGDFAELATLGQHCSERERRAEAAERELTKVKLLVHLSRQIGLQMDAVVTGVQSYGLFARGIELPAEGLIHIDSLTDDYYRFDRTTHTLSGHRVGNTYRLGDMVRVAIARVDLDRRELDFRVLDRKPSSSGNGKQTVGRKTRAKTRRRPGDPGTTCAKKKKTGGLVKQKKKSKRRKRR